VSEQADFDAKRHALAAEIERVGGVVRTLKGAASVDEAALAAALSELRHLKEQEKTLIKAFTKQFASEKLDINRDALEDLLRRRLFFVNSFEIYGGEREKRKGKGRREKKLFLF
jgi:hypothetical protein